CGVFRTVHLKEDFTDHRLLIAREVFADPLLCDEPIIIHFRSKRVIEGKNNVAPLFLRQALVEGSYQRFGSWATLGRRLIAAKRWHCPGPRRRHAGQSCFYETSSGDFSAATAVTKRSGFWAHVLTLASCMEKESDTSRRLFRG